MAIPAMDVYAMSSALWEAAKAGNTAKASRLIDAGALVNRSNAAEVSTELDRMLPAGCRGHAARVNRPEISIPPAGVLQRGPREKTGGPWSAVTSGAV